MRGTRATGARTTRGAEIGHEAGREPLRSSSSSPASYYRQPVIKAPVWKGEIAAYLFFGGLAGASAPLAALARDPVLARRAWAVSLLGVGVSPVLLIADLGRPARFLHMLRVVRPTSPMNMGAWLLSGSGAAIGLAAARAWLGWFERVGGRASVAAVGLGPALATYTGVLLADTAVPAWHEARSVLPGLFAASAAASAGAAAAVLTPAARAAPARRLAVAGGVAELALFEAMQRRLGPLLGSPYRSGTAARPARAARALGALGVGVTAALGARRAGAVAGGALLLAGAACTRLAVFRAGFDSASEPDHTVVPQRRRLEAGVAHRQAEQAPDARYG